MQFYLTIERFSPYYAEISIALLLSHSDLEFPM